MVLKLSHALEYHLASGHLDYLVRTHTSEMMSYRKPLGGTPLRLPHVRESKSYIIMEEIKESLDLPVPG